MELTNLFSTPDSFYEQALLGYTDAHCVFDPANLLVSWSQSFESLYPALKSSISVRTPYREVLRCLITSKSVLNFPKIEDIDAWLDEHTDIACPQSRQYVHQLNDGRHLHIKRVDLDNGYWFLGVSDISESYVARKERRLAADKFSQFAELASDWFWELDKDLCYLYHSRHKPRKTDPDLPESLVGVSRIEDLQRHGIVQDEQLAEHNACLLNRQPVDMVLTIDKGKAEQAYVHISAQPRFAPDGDFLGYIGCGRDISDIFKLQQQLSFVSSRDSLTGLLNRRSLIEALQTWPETSGIPTSGAEQSDTACVAIFDLDHFKMINETSGNVTGDRVLKQFAVLLEDQLPANSILARLGGDEFAALVPVSTDQLAPKLARQLAELQHYEFLEDDPNFRISVSAGLVDLSGEPANAADILRRADIACSTAKQDGRATLRVYNPESKFLARQDAEITHLKIAESAINKSDFELYLQPIRASHDTSDSCKFEVLVRFFDDDKNVVNPADVIAVAEKYDLMHILDTMILKRSLALKDELQLLDAKINLSVNLSGMTLGNNRYLAKVADVLLNNQRTVGSLEGVCIEVTETAAMKNVESVKLFIERFRQYGCKFSLDDFGSGLASFAYLKVINADYLKIDGSFISNILQDETSQAIVKSFNTLAHELGMQTVAEFVENEEIAHYLQEQGIDYLQGYGIGKPAPSRDWIEQLTTDSDTQMRRVG